MPESFKDLSRGLAVQTQQCLHTCRVKSGQIEVFHLFPAAPAVVPLSASLRWLCACFFSPLVFILYSAQTKEECTLHFHSTTAWCWNQKLLISTSPGSRFNIPPVEDGMKAAGGRAGGVTGEPERLASLSAQYERRFISSKDTPSGGSPCCHGNLKPGRARRAERVIKPDLHY